MKVLHVVPGLNEPQNGIAGAAKDIARLQGADIVDTCEFLSPSASSAFDRDLSAYGEIWVHSNWRLSTLLACRKVIGSGVPLVRMPHANLDPLRYRSKWYKKVLAAWYERRLYRKTVRVVVTCEAEREWCEQWGVKGPFETLDLKRFYRLDRPVGFVRRTGGEPVRVLYLGRRHPLKGVACLERAVREVNDGRRARNGEAGADDAVLLHVVSDRFGEALEAEWRWCDVLCLPTLSENFGRVVGEALEHGRFVVTTDGAPAWKTHFERHPDAGLYLNGYRAGSEKVRVRMLVEALTRLVGPERTGCSRGGGE